MDPDKKSPRVPPAPASENSEQPRKDSRLEHEAPLAPNGHNPFYDPYDHLALAHEPNG
jgi:hypothetical protein